MNAPDKNEIFERCQSKSDEVMKNMRDTAAQTFSGRSDIIVGVNGSLARREFTSGSDVDYFILKTGESAPDDTADQNVLREAFEAAGLKMPSTGGVFETTLLTSDLLAPIGGDDDVNKTLTRRMLFLLEGEWIYNEEGFKQLRRNLIEKYVSDDLGNGKLPLYLLNDIVRYWRTICIDYEHKTADQNKAKPLRLAKLRISRMLLCFAGMITVGEVCRMDVAEKRTRLEELFTQPALNRLENVLSEDFLKARSKYGEFPERINDQAFRDALDVVEGDGLQSNQYKEISEVARSFKEALMEIFFSERYGVESGLVRALLL